jgi:serine/threonine protein kinase/tetratricopeptide (TPR) repeat protein
LETGLTAEEFDTEDGRECSASPVSMCFGDYQLLEQIGRGGQGVVFRARQHSLNRIVALKVIALGRWATPAHIKRFRREAETAASLDHPGIVPIYEVGEREGSCYFSMKFIEGGQLDEVVRRAPRSLQQSAELIATVARTAHYAHEHGMVHRDIKPGNILIDAQGVPHLTDFGLARLIESESTVTRTVEVMGTPSYMAPEQAAGNNAAVTQATDVYGLGAVLYQLLTGHPPFAGGTTYGTIKLVLETEPRPPRQWNRKIDRDLSTICLKCLEKDPHRRYASAQAMAEDLERWLRHEPIRARHAGWLTRTQKFVRRNATISILAAALVVLGSTLGWNLWKTAQPPVTTGIAVLPFQNLSEQKEDVAFVDSVQDDVLTRLAKIAGLKVISRTSVMEYRGKQNVRRIGSELRVSHVLEGSVRRSGNRLQMNVQLIDARTDTHVWAEQYARDLGAIFDLQTEVAEKVAQQLGAKISPAEKRAIQRRPTQDLVAFDLYSRANDILSGQTDLDSPGFRFQAIELLNEAIARDPTFLEAYCQLAFVHDVLYSDQFDRTPARLALAEQAIDSAFRVAPGSGEAHLARAIHLYRGYRDYRGALAELALAHRTLPNEARLFQLQGHILNREGRLLEAMQSLERALELDPHDVSSIEALSGRYAEFRRHAESKQLLTRSPTSNTWRSLDLPVWEMENTGNPRPLHQAIESIRKTRPAALPLVARLWLECALAERDPAAAAEALQAMKDENGIGFGDEIRFNRAFLEGFIARMANNEEQARLKFAVARAEQQKIVEAQPDFGPVWCALGVIDAALGRKEDALREGRRAMELLPLEKDARLGKQVVIYFAMIAAWTGEQDLACQHLSSLIGPPDLIGYGPLKLSPVWDPLRGNPRFEKIVATLAPAESGPIVRP